MENRKYVNFYNVLDTITGEVITFRDKCAAEQEAKLRLNMHRRGYDIRRNHIPGCDAKLRIEEEERSYIIYVETGDSDK